MARSPPHRAHVDLLGRRRHSVAGARLPSLQRPGLVLDGDSRTVTPAEPDRRTADVIALEGSAAARPREQLLGAAPGAAVAAVGGPGFVEADHAAEHSVAGAAAGEYRHVVQRWQAPHNWSLPRRLEPMFGL